MWRLATKLDNAGLKYIEGPSFVLFGFYFLSIQGFEIVESK